MQVQIIASSLLPFLFFGLNQSGQEEAATIITPVFHATVKERRTADNRTADAVFLTRYTEVSVNTGNVFNGATGTFTVPADGYYHLTGAFEIAHYACRTRYFLENPVSFDVTLIRNNTQTLEEFRFPVQYSSTPAFALQQFNVLLHLNAGETIRLKIKSKKCDPGKEAWFHKAVFSGFRID